MEATVPHKQDVSCNILVQRVQNIELKLDTLEKSIQHVQTSIIQTLRDDFITISYQRQKFQAITCQFKGVTNYLFTKSLQVAFAAAAASMAVQPSQQD